ncbi:MAG TPA: hypothetical protein VK968_20560 [Roseimicrobium sp.]|nr:hypothetical protein [Roseimicrobium sp.]
MRAIVAASLASKELQPLITDTAAMIEAMDSFATGQGSYDNLKTRWQNMVGRYATVFSDRALMEKLVREGY